VRWVFFFSFAPPQRPAALCSPRSLSLPTLHGPQQVCTFVTSNPPSRSLAVPGDRMPVYRPSMTARTPTTTRTTIPIRIETKKSRARGWEHSEKNPARILTGHPANLHGNGGETHQASSTYPVTAAYRQPLANLSRTTEEQWDELVKIFVSQSNMCKIYQVGDSLCELV